MTGVRATSPLVVIAPGSRRPVASATRQPSPGHLGDRP
ncbi:MAG: hypothetical protein JWQ99_2259 [Blastococcus sp.]|jgi:hypothetical protein|nr:hypothetical protein [Blastococcus sp.]